LARFHMSGYGVNQELPLVRGKYKLDFRLLCTRKLVCKCRLESLRNLVFSERVLFSP
jgi:hypothetical protein